MKATGNALTLESARDGGITSIRKTNDFEFLLSPKKEESASISCVVSTQPRSDESKTYCQQKTICPRLRVIFDGRFSLEKEAFIEHQ